MATLFLAGIIPGILMVGGVMALAGYYSIKRNYSRNEDPFPGVMEFLNIFRKATLVLIIPLIIVGEY